MTLSMNDSQLITLKQLETFFGATRNVEFIGSKRKEKYEWIEKVIERFFYFTLRKKDKATVKKYVMKITGYSDAQITRLISRKKTKRHIIAIASETRARFKATYTVEDVALLSETDEAHGRLSGPATKKLFERAFAIFHDTRFVRLKNISVSHLYRLRTRRQYLSSTTTFAKTRPSAIPIGERRKPEPYGKPGYLRVDSVHQGDRDKEKGVYHINLVDEATQWEIVGCVEGISEAFLAPLLEALLKQFPFKVIGFHSDNGSEYINYVVAKLLNKLSIDQTKSRPRRSNDNALVEGKNGSVIRKHMGYVHIAKEYASSINGFYQKHFNAYLNFHRPCGYATTTTDTKGKERKIYDLYETPYEHLQKIPNAASFLQNGITFEKLDALAHVQSDNECAKLMQEAKYQLFKAFK